MMATAACACSSRARICSSLKIAMMSPAFTASPSRNLISRMRPLVFGEIAESSPSTRPLRATILSGDLLHLLGRHLQIRPDTIEKWAREHIKHDLAHDAVRAKAGLFVSGRQTNQRADDFAHLVV